MLNKKKAFSLIELLLVIVLIAGLTVTMLKNFNKKSPTIQEQAAELSQITEHAFLSSMLDMKIYQVRFFFDENQYITGYATGDIATKEDAKKKQDLQIKKVSSKIKVKEFLVDGKDELKDRAKEIWILFFPEGHGQDISFVIQKKTQELSYTINPFSGIIEEAEREKNEPI